MTLSCRAFSVTLNLIYEAVSCSMMALVVVWALVEKSNRLTLLLFSDV